MDSPRADASNRHLVFLIEYAKQHHWSFDDLVEEWSDNSWLPPDWIAGCARLAREMGMAVPVRFSTVSFETVQRGEVVNLFGGDHDDNR